MADDLQHYMEATSRLKTECVRLAEESAAKTQALIDLHESLFIGSERGLSQETLGKMARFARDAALAREWGSGDGKEDATKDEVLRRIADPSYVGNYKAVEVVRIYRRWAIAALARLDEENAAKDEEIERLSRNVTQIGPRPRGRGFRGGE